MNTRADMLDHRTSLRILHVVPAYAPAMRYGGPIRSVHALCSALARRGHHVEVYTTSVDGPNDLDVPTDRAVERDGVGVRYFRVPAFRRLFWSPALERHVDECVGQFDVVHLHSLYLWPTLVAARAAHRAGVPYAVSPRGMLVGELIRRKNRWVKTAWLRFCESRSLVEAALLHVTSDSEGRDARDVAESLGLNLPPISCVPNGVQAPPRSAERVASLAAPHRPYALFLGRISWEKGLDRLLDAWPQVSELALVIAGNDEAHYRTTLLARARALGIESRVHFIGAADETSKWTLLGEAELLVLPSYSENFGNVVAEAMAAGCPVVVTPEVGLATFVARTGAGVVAAGTPPELAQAINALHFDAARRGEMSVRGPFATQTFLSWPAIARRMESHYRDMLTAT
jgi:glycosyltransferase involved in cell wall biosynthesis